jgi:hypothetical protein
MGKRDGLRAHHTDHQAADQARPSGDGDRIELREAEARLAHGLGDDLVQALNVGARSYLRHHAAVGAMLLPLRAHHIRQDAAAAIFSAGDHGCGGLIAARLDAQHQQPGRRQVRILG